MGEETRPPAPRPSPTSSTRTSPPSTSRSAASSSRRRPSPSAPAELIEEVSEGKITGEEDRYSHTDLWDFDANVDGSKKLFELLTPALQAKDAALTAEIAAGFAAVDKSLAEYANADGSFDSYTALQAADKTRMQAELADLSEKLARIPGVLGLKG